MEFQRVGLTLVQRHKLFQGSGEFVGRDFTERLQLLYFGGHGNIFNRTNVWLIESMTNSGWDLCSECFLPAISAAETFWVVLGVQNSVPHSTHVCFKAWQLGYDTYTSCLKHVGVILHRSFFLDDIKISTLVLHSHLPLFQKISHSVMITYFI